MQTGGKPNSDDIPLLQGETVRNFGRYHTEIGKDLDKFLRVFRRKLLCPHKPPVCWSE